MTGVQQAVFKPYLWQVEQWRAFQQWLVSDRMPHALLLSGPSETGKKHFAMAVAARLQCNAPVRDAACGACKNCQLVSGGAHPDVAQIQPDEPGKAIPVDAIRALTGFANKTAMQGGWRVVVIEPAEMMTPAAANALLKTLEEPGSNTLLMLVHHQDRELLATIRSRCQMMRFPIPQHTLARDWLQACTEPDVDVGVVLEAAAGRPLRALRMIGDESLKQMETVREILDRVRAGTESVVSAAEQCKALAAAEVVEYLLVWHVQSIKKMAATRALPGPSHFVYMDQLFAARRRLSSATNPNPQMLLEELFMGWRQI